MNARTRMTIGLTLAAVIGVGAQRAAAQATPSAFAGSFAGSYTFSSTDPRFGNQAGYLALAINETGKVAGNVQNTTINLPATLSGSVNEDGDFTSVVEASNQVYTLKGTMVKTKAGHLKATLTQYLGSNQAIGSVQFDIPPAK